MKVTPHRRPVHAPSKLSGFSLVELVITMTIMTILVGVVSMRASGMTDKARSAKIVGTVENLRTPVTLYQQDTNQLPREYSGYQGATYHRLYQDPGVSGWDGPYITDPIRRSWNPTGGQVHIYNTIPAAYANNNGFDMDGDGSTDVIGNQGCVITFWTISLEVAQKVDRAFDESLPGTWSDAGRVEYQEGNQRLTILLLDA
ncbi:MAG: prepilin-type N-terminal cleavage/methylation domain-containing protein [Planctomycetota bacterium]|jgi:prepilin-type N-terminal cleavage/methylation domain-containing protein